MLTSNEIKFWVESRKNVHAKDGIEWVMFCCFGVGDKWCIHTWEYKPTHEQAMEVESITMRSFEIYHNHLHIPSFSRTLTKIDVDYGDLS